MASLAADDSNHTVLDDDHPTTLATTDLQVAGATSSFSNMNLSSSQFSANSTAELSRDTPDSPLQRNPSTPSANSSDKPNPEVASTTCTIQSTAPVPVVYPPRRPNVFKTRQKHVHFPLSGIGAVAPRTVQVGTTTQELEAADGFSTADLQEFQAEIKDRMKKKSEMFMNMVRQSAWQRRRVEELGEVFEIED